MQGVDLILPSWQSNTPAFGHLANEILLSTSIKVIFLLYDQRSKDIATTFLTTDTSSHHEWLTINVDTKNFAKREYFPSLSDQNLVITILNDWYRWKIAYYKDMSRYPENANFLFVSADENLETDTIYQRLESLHQPQLFYYSAVFLHLTASAANCYTMKYQFDHKPQFILIELSKNRSVFDQLFWNRYKQLDKAGLSVTALMRFPYLFLGKRQSSKEMPGLYDYGVSGRFVYMTQIMADYLNATLNLFIHDLGTYKKIKKTIQFNLTNAKNAYLVGDRVPLVPAFKLRQ